MTDTEEKMRMNNGRFKTRIFTAMLLLLLGSCCGVPPSTITQGQVMSPAPVKLSSALTLHVIGVYQGALPETINKRPWWAQCQAMQDATEKGVPPSPGQCQPFMHPDKEQRTVTVNISDDTSPIILGLMAYESVTWQINTTPGVVIQKVVLAGYHQQRITGIGDAQVDVYTYDNSPCDRCVQKGRYFYSYERVPREMELAAGVKASSFQGNYTGGAYQIFKGMQ